MRSYRIWSALPHNMISTERSQRAGLRLEVSEPGPFCALRKESKALPAVYQLGSGSHGLKRQASFPFIRARHACLGPESI